MGLFVLIVASDWMSTGKIMGFDITIFFDIPDPGLWVTPFAACFVAIISMMFFTYVGDVFKDTTDVMFLCLAIDKDNHIERDNGFASMIKEGNPELLETPDNSDMEDPYGDDDDDDDASFTTPSSSTLSSGLVA